MKEFSISRLIKTEDLNHHGTLFAGRMSEWFVEGTFIAAADLIGNPQNIVCVKLHGLKFAGPATRGDIINLTTKVVYAGKTSLTVYGFVKKNGQDRVLVDGFITFVSVDLEGNKIPHNILLPEAENEEEARLREIAKNLR